MVTRLRRLPERTRAVLPLAACIGGLQADTPMDELRESMKLERISGA